MLFNSEIYLFGFLPLVVIFYFKIASLEDKNLKKLFLIFSGIIFYSWWKISFLPIIIFSILCNYFAAKYIKKTLDKNKKKLFLILSISFNVLILVIFKYLDFLIKNINFFLDSNFEKFNIPFPLAISFITFQTIAFLIDVYDDDCNNFNFVNYTLFIIFFPQLIAGPIVKFQYMINQFNDSSKNKFIFQNFILGLIILFIGFLKKVLLADNLGIFVDAGYQNADNLNFIEAWITTLSFTFQFYFDFSGYIDMATGSALMLNLRLPVNFDSPFKATSVINFWRRWHITLSNFLTNYIYLAWATSVKKMNFFKNSLIVLIVFLIAGLWHGPSWLFVIFGVLHGIGIIVNNLNKEYLKLDFGTTINQILTFLYINFTLIFFRSENIFKSYEIILSMIGLNKNSIQFNLSNFIGEMNVENNYKIFIFVLLIISIVVCFAFNNNNSLIEKYFKDNLKS